MIKSLMAFKLIFNLFVWDKSVGKPIKKSPRAILIVAKFSDLRITFNRLCNSFMQKNTRHFYVVLEKSRHEPVLAKY